MGKTKSSTLQRLIRPLQPLLDRDRFEEQLDAELRFHYDERVDDHLRSGMSEPAARRAARLEFGGIEQLKEECRDTHSFLWLGQFFKDVFYGARMLVHNPGFTVIAVLSLALGIAANTVIFSLIETTLLRPLDYQDPARLVAIWTVPKGHPDQRSLTNASSYLAWKKQSRSFESMGSFFPFESSLGSEPNGTPAERVQGQYVSSSLLPALGVTPALGRVFTEQEGAPLSFTHVVLISDRLWERHYARDPRIVGRIIELDGAKNTVIGVMPRGFNLFEDNADYWAASGITRQRLESGGGRVAVVGRLKPGTGIAQAQTEMDALAARISANDPSRNGGNGASVKPLQESYLGQFRNPLLLLQGAVAFVLLIACANVTGLLLARGASRQTEIAVRTAVGAGRWRVVRQLLTESAVLALAGGALGVALAWGGLRLFISVAPPDFPRLHDLKLDTPVLAFTAAISLITGMIFGLVPALQLSRPDLIEALKAGAPHTGIGLARQRFRASLATLQVALALMLLTGAGLMINSFLRIEANNLGMDPRGILVFQFRYPALQVMKPVGKYGNNGLYDVSPHVTATLDRMVERLRHVPGVLSVAAATAPPTGSAMTMNFRVTGPITPAALGTPAKAFYVGVTPGYFATMKTDIVKGRDFTPEDIQSTCPVAIVNEAMARRYWPGRSALGEIVTPDYLPNDPPRRIVGIVSDVRLSRMQQIAHSIMYVPIAQQGKQWIGPSLGVRAGAYFVLRSQAASPMSLLPAARKAVAEIEPAQPLANIETAEAFFDDQIQYTRLYMLMLGLFGGVAAILAAVGIYGVMSFGIAQRTREIGIRMALGADRNMILALVGRHAACMIGIGLILGLAGSLALTRLLESALWNVKPTDPLTFIAVSACLTVVALLACIVPTRQAVRVDPAVAVRRE